MRRALYYTMLLVVLMSWVIGKFYLEQEYYIHSLLVMAGLMLAFRYVYKLRPATA